VLKLVVSTRVLSNVWKNLVFKRQCSLWALLTVPADYVIDCSFLKRHGVQETHEGDAA
jgi:hypothetical protein